MDVIFLAEGAGRDCACCHACRDAARETGEKQCQREDEPCSRAEDGGERVCCDGEVVYDDALLEKGCRSEDDHCGVDGPAYDHGEEGIGKLILEPLLHDCLAPAFEVLALNDLGVQKEVMGHNNSAEDAHDNGTGTCGKRRHDPALGGLGPPHLHERKLCQEGKADERDEADDPALYMLVGVRGKKDERDSGHKDAADLEGKRKEHLERDGST